MPDTGTRAHGGQLLTPLGPEMRRVLGHGAPALQGTLASVEADVECEHAAGDHTIVVAQETGLRTHGDRGPLLFYRGGYGGFDGGRHA